MEDRNNQLAPTVFSTKPKEILAAVDVYKEKAIGVVNSIQDFALKHNVDIAAIVRGGKTVAQLLPVVKNVLGELDKGNLMQRVVAASKAAGPLLERLPEGMKATIANVYEEYGDTLAYMGEVATIVSNTDFKDMNDLGKLINKLSGDGLVHFEDQDGLAALTVGIIKEATAYGIPNSFEALTATISNSDLLMKVTNGCLPITIDSSDIGLLNDINRAYKSGNLIDVAPNILKDISKNYDLGFDTYIQDVENTYNKINDTYNAVSDKWNKKDWSGVVQVLDTNVLKNASGDFKDVFDKGSKSSKPAEPEQIKQNTDNQKIVAVEKVITSKGGYKSVDELILHEQPFSFDDNPAKNARRTGY